MNDKAHLSSEGLKEIRKIKLNMNKGRYKKKGKVSNGKVKYLLIYCVFTPGCSNHLFSVLFLIKQKKKSIV